MQLKLFYDKQGTNDLNLISSGIEDCNPIHTWGPGVRDYYLIHYIIKGKGTFSTQNCHWSLGPGDGFLISPDTIVSYSAAPEDPWTYSWIGFNGLLSAPYLSAANITKENPIFHYSDDDRLSQFIDIINSTHSTGNAPINLGLLYQFLGTLIESLGTNEIQIDPKESYVAKAIEYIEYNYANQITVSQIADHVGLDRSYLYSLFKDKIGTSPKEFITTHRINRAIDLLQNPALRIGDVSRSVGFEDQLQFSKIFKKYTGKSPKMYRD